MKRAQLFAYSALGLPLAMAMLPIYMISPKFYGDSLRVNLSALGFVLFLTRLLDTVQDPWIGRLVDILQAKKHGWPILVCFATTSLSCGFVMLFSPPTISESGLLFWLAASLFIVYTSHSLINVCYLTWGTRLSDHSHVRTRVAAWRETAGLFGVLLASILPSVLVTRLGVSEGYKLFAWLFVALLGLGSLITLAFTQQPEKWVSTAFEGWQLALSPKRVRRMLSFYLFNAMAVATPATLVLFYIDDVLALPTWAGLFLGLYFLSGLLTLPLWVWLAARVGKPRTWLIGSLISISALGGVLLLGRGDLIGYAVVCVAAGAALGVDLILPVAMMGDAIPLSHRQSTGFYFGLWALIAKLALAVSAGLSLPLLNAFGYVPGQAATASSVACLYAFLPALFKAVAIWILSPDIVLGEATHKELAHET